MPGSRGTPLELLPGGGEEQLGSRGLLVSGSRDEGIRDPEIKEGVSHVSLSPVSATRGWGGAGCSDVMMDVRGRLQRSILTILISVCMFLGEMELCDKEPFINYVGICTCCLDPLSPLSFVCNTQ